MLSAPAHTYYKLHIHIHANMHQNYDEYKYAFYVFGTEFVKYGEFFCDHIQVKPLPMDF